MPDATNNDVATASTSALPVKAVDQIRDALVTLTFASDGFYEDEAAAALDALDWLESHFAIDKLREG